ncbi:MAG TPA: hypothetical protein VLH85_04140, partial [Levilinea sp.]|nr:hypothetical protein [Levilinea sp.]
INLFTSQMRAMNLETEIAISDEAPAWQTGEVYVDRYDLSLDLTDPRHPTFRARLVVGNSGAEPLESLDFKLMAALQITYASFPFNHQGALLRFELATPLRPGETVDLQVDYAGQIQQVTFADNLPQLVNFIHPRGVRLSPQTAWYPQPVAVSGAATYRIQVKSTPGMHFAANLPETRKNIFESDEVSWVFLVGSPHLDGSIEGPISLVAARNDLPMVKQVLPVYAESLEQVGMFFQDVAVDRLILMALGEESGMPDTTPPSARTLVVVSSPWVLTQLLDEEGYGRFRIGFLPLFYDFWHLSGGKVEEESKLWLDQLARFLWIRSQVGADVSQIRQELGDDPGEFIRHIMNLYQSSGDTGLQELMYELQKLTGQGSLKSHADWEAWINEVSGAF